MKFFARLHYYEVLIEVSQLLLLSCVFKLVIHYCVIIEYYIDLFSSCDKVFPNNLHCNISIRRSIYLSKYLTLFHFFLILRNVVWVLRSSL